MKPMRPKGCEIEYPKCLCCWIGKSPRKMPFSRAREYQYHRLLATEAGQTTTYEPSLRVRRHMPVLHPSSHHFPPRNNMLFQQTRHQQAVKDIPLV